MDEQHANLRVETNFNNFHDQINQVAGNANTLDTKNHLRESKETMHTKAGDSFDYVDPSTDPSLLTQDMKARLY